MGEKLRPKQAAKFCTDHDKPTEPATLDTHRVTGGGPPFYKSGKYVLYDTDDLLEWCKSSPMQKYNSTSDYPPELRLKRKPKNGGE
jgi:hypothetical protein